MECTKNNIYFFSDNSKLTYLMLGFKFEEILYLFMSRPKLAPWPAHELILVRQAYNDQLNTNKQGNLQNDTFTSK
jgi:hypothetical protein